MMVHRLSQFSDEPLQWAWGYIRAALNFKLLEFRGFIVTELEDRLVVETRAVYDGEIGTGPVTEEIGYVLGGGDVLEEGMMSEGNSKYFIDSAV